MRRKPGAILPIERSILDAAVVLKTRGNPVFHGFLIASQVKEREDAKSLTAYGTLYKALERMERAGLLSSRWEDPQRAADEGRPRRRLYEVTAAGEQALASVAAGLQPEAARP